MGGGGGSQPGRPPGPRPNPGRTRLTVADDDWDPTDPDVLDDIDPAEDGYEAGYDTAAEGSDAVDEAGIYDTGADW